MSEASEMDRYIGAEVEALEPFDFVAIGPPGQVFNMVEICRGEGKGLEVRIPGRPVFLQALTPAERASLRDRGFVSKKPDDQSVAWTCAVSSDADAIALARAVIHQIFEAKPDIRYDVIHGSHRAEHDAKLKLAEVRVHVEHVISEVTSAPPIQDDEGDYLLALGDVQVVVAPRSVPAGPTLVRVFTVTNIGMTVTPDLGLMLARLNFSLMFGRFSLDTERKAILFDETLLGDPLNQEALRYAIQVVSTTADEWDDRLKQMFGGATYQEVLKQKNGTDEPLGKPGQGDGRRLEHGLYL